MSKTNRNILMVVSVFFGTLVVGIVLILGIKNKSFKMDSKSSLKENSEESTKKNFDAAKKEKIDHFHLYFKDDLEDQAVDFEYIIDHEPPKTENKRAILKKILEEESFFSNTTEIIQMEINRIAR